MARRIRHSLSQAPCFAALLACLLAAGACGGGGSSAANLAGNWRGNFNTRYACTGIGEGSDNGTIDLQIVQEGSLVSGEFTVLSQAFGEVRGGLSGSVSSNRMEATLFSGNWVMTLSLSLAHGILGGVFVADSINPDCRMNGSINTTRVP